MEMEVMIPTAAATDHVEFNFESACTTPYISAPSSPQRFGSNFFYSAPTSPTRLISSTAVPFDWEEKPGNIPYYKAKSTTAADDDDDFAFDFSGHLDGEISLTTADELFDAGKIKPLKPPPPGLTTTIISTPPDINNYNQMTSYKDASFSPRNKGGAQVDDFILDPFAAAAALEQTTTGNKKDSSCKCNERGRERMSSTAAGRNIYKKSGRSLSPFRVSDLLLDDSEGNEKGSVLEDDPTSGGRWRRFSTSSLVPSSFVSFWYRRKWKLKDLLLFRSASDGHAAMTKEQLNKYAVLNKEDHDRHHGDVKSSSFRSTESCGSSCSSSSRQQKIGGAVSAHELHYRTKRAMAQDMKRKTSLPYKPPGPGFFGCLGYNPPPSSIHHISRNVPAAASYSSTSHLKQ